MGIAGSLRISLLFNGLFILTMCSIVSGYVLSYSRLSVPFSSTTNTQTLATNTTHIFFGLGNGFFVDNIASMGLNKTILFEETSTGVIISSVYDEASGAVLVCTDNRHVWMTSDGISAVLIQQRSEGLAWKSCAYDSVNDVLFVASEQEIGAIPNVRSQQNSSAWFSTTMNGAISQLRTVVVGGDRVYFGGANGNVFVTPTSNYQLSNGLIQQFTRTIGRVQSLAFGSSRNRLFVGSDQGVLTEVVVSTMVVSRQINVNAPISSIIIDDDADTLFLNTNFNGASVITRFNLNEPEFEPIDTLTLPEPVVASVIDPRPDRHQMIYYNSLGTTLYIVSVANCHAYSCDTCYFDRNYCGFCQSTFACSTASECSDTSFFKNSFVCPLVSNVAPLVANAEEQTLVTFTGNFFDASGNILSFKDLSCKWQAPSLPLLPGDVTVLNASTVQCQVPNNPPMTYNLTLVVKGVEWYSTLISTKNCGDFSTSTCLNNGLNCGLCLGAQTCTARSKCNFDDAWTSETPTIVATPMSAHVYNSRVNNIIISTNVDMPQSGNLTIVTSFDTAKVGLCKRISAREIHCSSPKYSGWPANAPNPSPVYLRLRINNFVVAEVPDFNIYLCANFYHNCGECTSSLTNGDCSFCFNAGSCYDTGYLSSCNQTGACPIITSASPPAVYYSNNFTVLGDFRQIYGLTIYCCASTLNCDLTNTAQLINSSAILCPAPKSPGGLSVTIRDIAGFILTPAYSMTAYDCSGQTCSQCLSVPNSDCTYCMSSLSCKRQSDACPTVISNTTLCPAVTSITPPSFSSNVTENSVVEGSFGLQNVDSISEVICTWRPKDADGINIRGALNNNRIFCPSALANGPTIGDVTVVLDNRQLIEPYPVSWYNCDSIVGDCSKCLSAATTQCTWCGNRCTSTCSVPALAMKTCPSLTSVTPDHSHTNGNELITVTGGPFFDRSGYIYECRFGDLRAQALVVNVSVIQCRSPPILSPATVDFAVYLNGLINTPSTVPFEYFACPGTRDTTCTSSCASQKYCGWCSSTSTCTASSLCSAVDDMFLPQCLGVTLDPPFLSIGQSQDVTVRVSPKLPEFVVLSTLSSNKRATQQVVPTQLVTCSLGDQSINAVIKSSTEIVCPSLSSSSSTTVSLTVKFNNTVLFTPVSFNFVDCSTASSCSDCTALSYCGWCASASKCTTQSSCSDTWISDCSSPSASVLPGPDPAIIVPAVVIPVVVVAVGLVVLIVLLKRRNKQQKKHGNNNSHEDEDEELTEKGQSIKVINSISAIDEKLRIPNKSLSLKKELGSGSYGKVYLGEWQGAKVAIKVCASVANVDGFFEEAALTVGLPPHPNVVQTFGISVDGPLPYIVLEFCGGGSLDKKLFDDGVEFSMNERVSMIKGIARGLLHLHNHNIVHRDLAARNILLTLNNEPKISDFGMSRLLKEESQKGQTKNNVGPVRWMSPESLRDLSYSTKSDVWSFGVLMYEILSGCEPHTDVDGFEVAVKIKNENYHPRVPSELPMELQNIMLSCWKPDPADRPSMAELLTALSPVSDS